MPSGTLGTAVSVANTNVTVYTVPPNVVATVTINIFRRGSSLMSCKVWICPSDNPSDRHLIEDEDDFKILERGGKVCGPGDRVIVQCSSAAGSIRVEGFEEPL